eukprot:COSAG01_NODE_8050_length_2940_cov_10.377332_1_plen_173_part_00
MGVPESMRVNEYDIGIVEVDNCNTMKGKHGGAIVLFDELRWDRYCEMKASGIRGGRLGPWVPLETRPCDKHIVAVGQTRVSKALADDEQANGNLDSPPQPVEQHPGRNQSVCLADHYLRAVNGKVRGNNRRTFASFLSLRTALFCPELACCPASPPCTHRTPIVRHKPQALE